MKTKLMALTAVAAALGFSATVQASTVNGQIEFGIGTVTSATSGLDTTVTFSNPWSIEAGNGNYTGLTSGSVTFSPITFVTSSSTLTSTVNPLWTFVIGSTTYDFNLSALTAANITPGSIALSGNGTAQITGETDNTAATWSLQGTGNGGYVFNFSSTSTSSTAPSVPDGGTTVILLGAALSGLAFVKRQLVA